MGVLADIATELPTARLAVEQAEKVPGHVSQEYAALKFAPYERKHGPKCLMPGFYRRCLPEELRIDACQQPGIVVRLPTQHHAVGMPEMLVALIEGCLLYTSDAADE